MLTELTLVQPGLSEYPMDSHETLQKPRRSPKLGSHQISCKTNSGSRRNPQKPEQNLEIVRVPSGGPLPAGPRTVLLFEKQSCSTSHMYESGRLREGTWASENAPKAPEIDFSSKICKILIFVKISIFSAHQADLDPTWGF